MLLAYEIKGSSAMSYLGDTTTPPEGGVLDAIVQRVMATLIGFEVANPLRSKQRVANSGRRSL